MAKNTNTAAVSTSTTSAPAAEQKKDGIFVQMLNATLSATEMVLAEKTGKLALDLLLQSPTTLEKIEAAQALTALASTTDGTTLHGKMAREIAFGCNLSAFNDAMNIFDAGGVMQVKYSAEAIREAELQGEFPGLANVDVITKSFKQMEAAATEGTGANQLRFNTTSVATNAQPLPANAKPKATAAAPAKAADPIAEAVAETVDVKADVTMPSAEVLPPAATVTSDKFVCPVCQRQTKNKKGRVFRAPNPDVATDSMKAVEGKVICAQCAQNLKDMNMRDAKEIKERERRQAQAEQKIEELTKLEAEIAADNETIKNTEAQMSLLTMPEAQAMLKDNVDKLRNNTITKSVKATRLREEIAKLSA